MTSVQPKPPMLIGERVACDVPASTRCSDWSPQESTTRFPGKRATVTTSAGQAAEIYLAILADLQADCAGGTPTQKGQ